MWWCGQGRANRHSSCTRKNRKRDVRHENLCRNRRNRRRNHTTHLSAKAAVARLGTLQLARRVAPPEATHAERRGAPGAQPARLRHQVDGAPSPRHQVLHATTHSMSLASRLTVHTEPTVVLPWQMSSSSPSKVVAMSGSANGLVSSRLLAKRNDAFAMRLKPYLGDSNRTTMAIEEARAASEAAVRARLAANDRVRKQDAQRRRDMQKRARVRASKTAEDVARATTNPGTGRSSNSGHAAAAAASTTVLASAVPAASCSLHGASCASIAEDAAALLPNAGGPLGVSAVSATTVHARRIVAVSDGYADKQEGDAYADKSEIEALRDLLAATNDYTGQPISADLTTPEALRIPWGGTAQRYYEASSLDRNRTQRHLPKWDFTPHKSIPYVCKGIKPIRHESHPVGRRDPWAKAADEAWSEESVGGGHCMGLGISSAGLFNLDDGRKDDTAMQWIKRAKEDKEKAKETNRPTWDKTPWVPTPSSLRGIAPTTKEPWRPDIDQYMAFEEARREEMAEFYIANQAWEDHPNRLAPSAMELRYATADPHVQTKALTVKHAYSLSRATQPPPLKQSTAEARRSRPSSAPAKALTMNTPITATTSSGGTSGARGLSGARTTGSTARAGGSSAVRSAGADGRATDRSAPRMQVKV